MVRPLPVDTRGSADPPAGWPPPLLRALASGDACSPFGDEVVPIGDRLVRDQFGMHRFDWSDATEFQIAHGEMLRLLRSSGFEIQALLELPAPEDAIPHNDWVALERGRRWPTDDVWMARKL
jgi:hypothetical protein